MHYLYSLAAMASSDDYTIMRPMVMDFTDDLAARSVGDQYMFGPAFLAAPVYRFGVRSRDVYFPAREKWYDFYTGRLVDGSGVQPVDAPYDRIPLYVRGGSIIPAGGVIQSTAERSTNPVTLIVYAGRDGDFTLYDDEGVNYNYERGLCARIPLHYDDTSSVLTIGNRDGSFPGMEENVRFNIVYITPSHPVADPLDASGVSVEYTGMKTEIRLK